MSDATQTQDVVERLRAKIGTAGGAVSSPVEAGHVRRFCEAIGDDDPRWLKEAPPTFVVALGSGSPPIDEAQDYGKGWLNGGDRFEYVEPILIGDMITAQTRLVDVYEKQGGSGSLLFLITETEYTNQHGRVAVRSRGTRIRR